MANQLVASSSLPPSWRYDVFLSFRGEDTRTNFTGHLYKALVLKKIKTFIDDDLPRGEEISPTLLKAIEDSRISVVILSKNYADSRWCLEELVKIHQCRESKQQIIYPVFYKVDPSHVRNQTGCYGAAFIDHERKFEDKEMVDRWRKALKKVANLTGYRVKEQDNEAEKIDDIVKCILNPPRVLDEIKQQQILALRSNNNKKYLRYIRQRIENLDGLVQFSEEDVKSEYAKFQIEPADSGDGGLVHIKCCFNNRYLRRANHRQFWIVAGAYEPLEDRSHWSCTLFKPVVVHSNNKAVFRQLIHVQLGNLVTPFTANDFHQCLYAGSTTTNRHDDMDVYTFVDLEQLVLTRSVALISNYNKKYLRYIRQGIQNLDELVQLSEEDVKSEYAKFQMEPADSGDGGLVHIKCCFNNKYLRRANNHRYWIVAGADEPEEDTKHWSCTLFKPVAVHSDNKAVCRLLHVQLRHFVTSFTVSDFKECLIARSNTPDLHDNKDVYTVIDLEPLVLPRSLALKSNNNKKYLRYIRQGIQNLDELVQLSEEDVKSEYAKFQIEPADSGYGGLVHIKCCFNKKYLRRANDHQYWIVAGADEPEEDTKHWSCTLFEPVVVHSDNKAVFRLLHVQLGHFVTSFTVSDFKECLFARSNTPDLLDDMDVYTVIDLELLVLPRSLALKSNNNKKYLCYIHQGIQNLDELVQLSEEDVKSEYAKFQIEPADSGYGGLVHIKCCFNNKYLRRANDHRYWIVAGADEPEEDTKHWSCTLFKPVAVHSDNKAVFRLLHVQLRHFVTSFTVSDFKECLFARSNTPDLHDNKDVYTVIDLEPLVLPRSLALKSNNNKKYLRYIHQGIQNLEELVQLSEEDVKSEYAKFQIEPADSGYGGLVHIKCCFNNKYLRRADDHQYWIVAGAYEPEEDKKHWSCTLFEPVVVHSDNKAVIRLIHVQLGRFMRSFTVNDFNLCLFAERNTPNLHNDMDVYTVVDLEPLPLPRSFALISNNNKKYLRYIRQRIKKLDEIVQLSEEDVKSNHAKFQMEPADSGYGGLVHIKCCVNNKYLRRVNDHQYLIVAGANEPEEDKKHWSCTLFEPVVVHSDNKAVFRLFHVQLERFVTSFTVSDFKECLFARSNTPDPHNKDVYTVIDLEPLVLPRSLALKSNNNKKYLRYICQRIKKLDEIVQLSEEDVKSEYAKFQIEPADSGCGGLVHIKCCFNNKYLRRANDHLYWIVAGADEPEEDKKHWSCTLFQPVVVHSDNKAVFRLLHVQLGHFVKSFTGNDFNQCLFAGSKTPNLHDDMDVYTVVDLEPLVLPSPFVLKSNNNNRCLRYMLDQENNFHQILQFSAQDRTSEFAQFHVERANSRDHQNNHYVHIKCLYNNKYLRRMEMDKYNPLILAAADNRDENTERWTCTLFKPESVRPTGNNHNNVLCRLRHVATGLYTKPFVDNRFELRLGEENPDPQEVDVYTAIRTHT
ncbi:uncharacterized protein LOC126593390 [Malus sylvestris]|uniref:uncharacterized protein LOC126593390 n=1 Tax=Malus sylvestris TaxID=3752 RepID=UPI0021ABE573|nr:uncharacterized protein LOC126593390 [Malus sylvestris]